MRREEAEEDTEDKGDEEPFKERRGANTSRLQYLVRKWRKTPKNRRNHRPRRLEKENLSLGSSGAVKKRKKRDNQ